MKRIHFDTNIKIPEDGWTERTMSLRCLIGIWALFCLIFLFVPDIQHKPEKWTKENETTMRLLNPPNPNLENLVRKSNERSKKD